MNVIAFDAKPSPGLEAELDFSYVSIDELLTASDIITLNSENAFRKMKSGVVIINTTRGEIVDSRALVRVLSEGKVAAAGLDVLPDEPVIREEAELLSSVYEREHNFHDTLADCALLRLRNVYVTPRNAFNTSEAVRRISWKYPGIYRRQPAKCHQPGTDPGSAVNGRRQESWEIIFLSQKRGNAMNQVENILKNHPTVAWTESDHLARCIQACYDCAATCVACGDACLGEEAVKDLVRCIRLIQDCTDVCETTGRMLARLTGADLRLIHSQLDACIAACQICGDECDMHGQKYEHCRMCAESCHRCVDECKEMLLTVQAEVV